MIGTTNPGVDVIRAPFVVDEIRDRSGRRHVLEGLDVRRARAESGAAQQVVDFGVELRHWDVSGDASERNGQDAVRKGRTVLAQCRPGWTSHDLAAPVVARPMARTYVCVPVRSGDRAPLVRADPFDDRERARARARDE